MEQNKQVTLQTWMERSGLKRKEAAAFLAIAPSKLSEYLNGKRKIPSYIHSHLLTLLSLSDKKLAALVRKRLG